MHKFQFRSPRYQVNLPVKLSFDDAILHGRCREISQEGMCLELQDCPGANNCGTASFHYETVSVEVGVCVARTGRCSGGMRFVFQTEGQRREIARLVAMVAARGGQSRPFLVE